MHLHAGGAVTYLEEGKELTFMGYSITQPGDVSTEQIAGSAVTAIFNLVKKLCGTGWRPTQVCFTHGKPENTRPLKRYFNAPLVFNAGQNGIVFSSSWLQQPLMGADPDLRLLLQRQIDLLESRHSDDFAEQVRRVIHSAVLTHQTNADYIADLFSVRQRTLNRRLRDCGTCFRELLNESRLDIARQLLENSSFSVSDIAAMLDYSDSSTFARAFRRQSSMAPAAWREQFRQQNS
jgi:AraC-like DNA-binding protein